MREILCRLNENFYLSFSAVLNHPEVIYLFIIAI